MNRSVGGVLDVRALAALMGQRDCERMKHWTELSHQDQIAAIHRMHDSGFTDRQIAHACQLSVEQICRLLGEQQEKRA